MNKSIPFYKFKGTYKEIGEEAGKVLKDTARTSLKEFQERLKQFGIDHKTLIEKSIPCVQFAKDYFPDYLDMIKGYCKGADLEFIDIFSDFCMDLLCNPLLSFEKKCTDILTKTKEGIILAHNEDDMKSGKKELCVVLYEIDGRGKILSLSYGGLVPSVGFNEHGIGIIGNALFHKDIKKGFPPDFAVMKVLTSKTFREAVSAAENKNRMSSYNNMIADIQGNLISVEASATELAKIHPNNNVIIHTNHYTIDKMRKFEDHPFLDQSISRLNQATHLAKNIFDRKKSLSVESIKTILSDHQNYPDSICKHSGSSTGDETLASTIINLSKKTMLVSSGNPCENEYKEFTF